MTRRALAVCALAMLSGAVPAQAAVGPGDLLVTDSGFAGILQVDPLSGRAAPFAANTDPVNASSQLFATPTDVVVDASGRILVTDGSAAGGTGAVIAVDPVTGKQSLVSSNAQPVNTADPLFAQPAGIDVLPSGQLLVVDRNAFLPSGGGVIAVDPTTGKQSVFSSNEQPVNAGSQLFGDPRGGIEILPSGTVLVGESGNTGRGVIGVDPATGKQSVFSSNAQPVNAGSGFYEIPVDILRTLDGKLFVADQNAFDGDGGGIVGVDAASGQQSKVSANDQAINATSAYYSDPFDLTLSTDGRIVVADASAFGGACGDGCGGLIAVDRATGRQQVLSNNDQPVNAGDLPYENPLGVAVVPLRCEGRQVTITGTPSPERLEGTGGPDVISAQGGKDRVLGFGGNDVVCAGGGADVVKGGGGKDRVLGEGGRDRLLGGDGRDKLFGGGGNDKLFGNSGKDRLAGGKGRDALRGGKGADRLRGGPGKDPPPK